MNIKASIRPTFKHTDTKSKIKFALWPRRIDDVIVWLGRYEILYVFVENTIAGVVKGEPIQFTTGKWQKVSERVI